MCHFEFKVDSELKHDYLNEKVTATGESDSFILRSVDEYEVTKGKSIYNMHRDELNGMIAMQFNNPSVGAVTKNVSIIRTYIDFCINKNVVTHRENRLATFTVEDAKNLVNQQVLLKKFITREQLKEYQRIIFNEQDKLILELPYIGGRGRTCDGCTSEEIINLRMSDVDEENKMITLTQNDRKTRELEVETSTIELIKDAYNQKIYVENNGEMSNNLRLSKPREIVINRVEDYILRIPSKDKFLKFTSNLITSRMSRMQKYLDSPYLTITTLYQSGMIQSAMDIYKEKCEVDKDDYKNICIRYNYGEDVPEKYWHIVKGLFEQYKELINNTYFK